MILHIIAVVHKLRVPPVPGALGKAGGPPCGGRGAGGRGHRGRGAGARLAILPGLLGEVELGRGALDLEGGDICDLE